MFGFGNVFGKSPVVLDDMLNCLLYVSGAIEIESLPFPRTHSFSDLSLDASIHQLEYKSPPEPSRPI